jgi:DNA-binding LacI/PurR family transcriptional regulator
VNGRLSTPKEIAVARVTLADVSREVGLGVATVSRALAVDPHPDVSEVTRERVRKVADRLGYRPSISARVLRSGGYHALSVIVPDFEWGWWEPAIRAAFTEAATHGYQVLVHPVAGQTGGASAVVESLGSVPTEGVLLFGSANDPDVHAAATALRLPVVTIDDVSNQVLFPTITVDSRIGMREATDHLLRLGRRRIVYFGTGNSTDTFFARQRLAGYKEALEAADLPIDPAFIVEWAGALPPDESGEYSPSFEEFLRSGVDFDAVVLEFDLLGAPLLRSLDAAGIKVPSDVAVVGFDDERAALLLSPQLTTMRQPYEQMSVRAVNMLLQAVRGETLQISRQLTSPTLIRRRSA